MTAGIQRRTGLMPWPSASSNSAYVSEDDTAPIDAAYLDRIANRYLLDKRVHIAAAVSRRAVVDVDGLPWGRIEGTSPEGAGLVVWLVPGRPRSALIEFVVPADALERLRPSLDAAARATRGAAPPPERADTRLRDLAGVTVLVAATGLLVKLRWSKRKS
jgi:hypothetical protein